MPMEYVIFVGSELRLLVLTQPPIGKAVLYAERPRALGNDAGPVDRLRLKDWSI